jgi:HSP20 family protein
MALVRYRPLRDMATLHDEMNRVFDNLLMRPATGVGAENWYPAADVRETENDYVVRTELPGVSKDDVKINLINNTLIIRGEKKQETEDQKGNWHHVERSYGMFERTFALPSAVSSDRIKARFRDGVLEVIVPKAEEARPREINIES